MRRHRTILVLLLLLGFNAKGDEDNICTEVFAPIDWKRRVTLEYFSKNRVQDFLDGRIPVPANLVFRADSDQYQQTRNVGELPERIAKLPEKMIALSRMGAKIREVAAFVVLFRSGRTETILYTSNEPARVSAAENDRWKAYLCFS